MAENAIQPVTCRPSHAKRVFGVSHTTIYRWVKEGHIKLYKLGGNSFLRVREVEDYICGLGDQMGDQSPTKK